MGKYCRQRSSPGLGGQVINPPFSPSPRYYCLAVRSFLAQRGKKTQMSDTSQAQDEEFFLLSRQLSISHQPFLYHKRAGSLTFSGSGIYCNDTKYITILIYCSHIRVNHKLTTVLVLQWTICREDYICRF